MQEGKLRDAAKQAEIDMYSEGRGKDKDGGCCCIM